MSTPTACRENVRTAEDAFAAPNHGDGGRRRQQQNKIIIASPLGTLNQGALEQKILIWTQNLQQGLGRATAAQKHMVLREYKNKSENERPANVMHMHTNTHMLAEPVSCSLSSLAERQTNETERERRRADEEQQKEVCDTEDARV